MGRAILVNRFLPEDIKDIVSKRLASFGYELRPWPDGQLVADDTTIAIVVVGKQINLSDFDDRIEEAVAHGLRVIVLVLEEVPLEGTLCGQLASSVISIGSSSLGQALDPNKPEVHEDADGKVAATIKIRHNKC